MSIANLRDGVVDEVSAILAADFEIDVVNTTTVPRSSDASITFPNLDTKRQGAKLINTCVLYIDIRRSTELNLRHKPKTVAKLYSAFVRAMTRCARHHKGHVRGIIGDRVMVIFDQQDAFVNAVECAISMNSVSQFVINEHFKHNEVECGIGIDAGNMLATKTGLRRKGEELHAYRNLVWLGRPANVASKLTDLANKPESAVTYPMVRAAFAPAANSLGAAFQLGLGPSQNWVWRDINPFNFLDLLTTDHVSRQLVYPDPNFRAMHTVPFKSVSVPKTAPILMTEIVWDGFRAAKPTSAVVTGPMFREVKLSVPGYKGRVYSGDVHFTDFKA